MKNLGWLYMYVRGLFSHKKYTAFSDLKDVLLETQKIIPLIYEVLYIYTFMYLQKNSIRLIAKKKMELVFP